MIPSPLYDSPDKVEFKRCLANTGVEQQYLKAMAKIFRDTQKAQTPLGIFLLCSKFSKHFELKNGREAGSCFDIVTSCLNQRKMPS